MIIFLFLIEQDIREIEIETAELLKKTMRAAEGGYEPGFDVLESESEVTSITKGLSQYIHTIFRNM